MRNWLAFLAAAFVSVAASAQQPGGFQPAAAGDIAAAVTDCWNAIGANAVDRAKLGAAGWKAATATGGRGKALALPLSFYGKAGGNAVIMLGGPTSSQTFCTVVAAVPSLQDLSKTVGTIQKTLVALDPQIKTARSGTGVVFIALPKLAIAEPTGTKEKPGLRIAVGYQNSEKK